jgi:NAD-dependent dihydropyrimidine dehydrogenase PreA subunit
MPPQPPAGWIPWFPVIDYDRCTTCRQCLEFCLFDVYERDSAGRVRVARPANCKTNCPACARVCPEAAILFPKYATSPFNGDEVPPGFKGGVDLAARLGGDPYAALRARGGGRFSTDTAAPPAAGRLAEALDIPPEVLASPEAAALRARLCKDQCACDCSGDSAGDGECECDGPCDGDVDGCRR